MSEELADLLDMSISFFIVASSELSLRKSHSCVRAENILLAPEGAKESSKTLCARLRSRVRVVMK